MAVNRKGGNPILALLLAHGEKLGIAVALLLTGWLAYGGIGYQGVEEEPNRLSQLAGEARRRVDEFTFNDAIEVEEGAKIADTFRPIPSVEVRVDDYEIDWQGLNPGVLPRTVLRPDPPLLAAAGLIVSGGTQLMGFEDAEYSRGKRFEEIREERRKAEQRKRDAERARADDRGRGAPGRDNREEKIRVSGPRNGVSLDDDDKAEIVSYAIVLAKVPVDEQIEAFQSALKGAAGFSKNADQPEYWGYKVERRSVSAGRVGEWDPVLLRNTFNDEKLDEVDPETIAITSLDWVEQLDEVAARDYLAEGITFPLPPLVGRDWGPDAVHPDVPLEAEAELAKQEEDRRDDRLGRDLGRRFRGREPEEALIEEDPIERLYAQPFVMLRFFDMTVRPGQQYQYRVRLIVRDPNASIDRRQLSKEVLQRMDAAGEDLLPDERFRLTPWSEPSPVASIPQAGGVLLSRVDPPRGEAYNAEPSVDLVVGAFDTLQGEIVPSATQRRFQRGGVANFRLADAPIIRKRLLETAEEFSFRTDVTVLDIRGGAPLGREETVPGAMLVMDASGRMTVRRELLDTDEAKATLKRYSGNEDDGRRGGNDFAPDQSGLDDDIFE